jgi:N-methylhydantoinase A
VAAILGSKEVMMPRRAGVMSAVGLLCAPLAFDFVHSWVGLLEELDWEDVAGLVGDMETAGREILARSSVEGDEVSITRGADMRYSGQGYEISVAVPSGSTSDLGTELRSRFADAYAHRYGRTLNGVPIEIVNWRCSAAGPIPSIAAGDSTDRPAKGPVRERPIYLASANEFVDVPVYDRYRMAVGDAVQGPAVIEEAESTFVVGQDAEIRVDEQGNLVATLEWGG